MEPWRAALAEVDAWCARRWWPPRALLAWLAWILGNHLVDDAYQSLFGGINLGIHEAGHLVSAWLGEWPCAAGGTFAQCAAPVAAGAVFARQRDWFAVAVAAAWLADNLYGVATYLADASAQALPLVTVGGGEARHDWAYLLGSVGMLGAEAWLAPLLRLAAFAIGWGAILAGGWMCRRMAARR